MIRAARAADADAICAIWNPLIADTNMTFSPLEKTADQVAELIAERPCFLVAESSELILGFVTYGPFRGGPGYAHTAEHSIMVDPLSKGQGAGRALMLAAMKHARANGIHVLVAGVAGENVAARAFHKQLGFAEVGKMPEVGRRWDRWLDLVLMQKRL
ncbi:GNAT family N-acetyltransferase [Pseudooctadecabacter jejudonensis]|uniref:GNAT family N-acetyltransferase n=1 Tax=Pseudooctadecabacter jejudonensis TaxID=1391910 RepID=UPI000A26C727|nr:GNAT family N-acetyltransferase [Pseudooctadecabacter jejudonensis]